MLLYREGSAHVRRNEGGLRYDFVHDESVHPPVDK